MQGFSPTSAHSMQYHAEEQGATAAGHPVAGAAAAASQCEAAPSEAASDATLQSLLAGALASAGAAPKPSGQLHGGNAQGQDAILGGGAVPWLPPGPLSSWHGYQGGTAAPLAGFLRPGAAGGLRPAEAVANILPAVHDNCSSGATGVPFGNIIELHGT